MYLLISYINHEQVILAKLVKRATALAVPFRRLSWSIFSHFVAINPWSAHRSRKSQKKTL